MSGESEVGASISALAKLGYESTQLTFNDDSPWLSLIWLTVVERAPDSVIAIGKTVRSLDPGAVRI
jgi:hypothetical protein